MSKNGAIGKRVVVSNAVVKLADKGCIVKVRNRDAANSADIGGSAVAAGAGYELKPGDAETFDCRADDLFAIRSAGVDVTRLDVLITRAAGF